VPGLEIAGYSRSPESIWLIHTAEINPGPIFTEHFENLTVLNDKAMAVHVSATECVTAHPSPDCSVIIVNWNTKDLLNKCLSTLFAQTSNISLEVFVVDNGSTDQSREMIQSKYPQVNLIANTENRGFADANNQAASLANGHYLLILNPDTILPEGAIEHMIEYADKHEKCGILGPKLLSEDGSLQRSCWPIYPGIRMAFSDALYLWKVRLLPVFFTSEYPLHMLRNTIPVAHILGACMLIRHDTWSKAGPMDENYFLYMEETKLCFNARQHGWQIIYNPFIEIVHLGQRSSRQIPEKSLRNFYISYYRFCKEVRQYSLQELFMLKLLLYLGVIVRLGLWNWRLIFSRNQTRREQALSMINGYSRAREVITNLKS